MGMAQSVIKVWLVDQSKARRVIEVGEPIAQGAAGTIHRVLGERGVVAKLYKKAVNRTAYEAKVAAMLASPPDLPTCEIDGGRYVQIAWPLAALYGGRGCEFLGFTMPEVDFKLSQPLDNIMQRAKRQQLGLPEDYRKRVVLALNLAGLMNKLHSSGHYMIDMKPQNMRFYPAVSYLAILDTDGFSINGPTRFPAEQFSDGYIAPDCQGKKPAQLGLPQDLFALAVIIFRLLNNGLHPFQGLLLPGQPTTEQERIGAGLYAYGQMPNRKTRPAPSSIHESFEDNTRDLFDRAFRNSPERPTAQEWHDHLRGLIANKILVPCAANREHAHFSRGCGLCELDRVRQEAAGARRAAESEVQMVARFTAPTGNTGNAGQVASRPSPSPPRQKRAPKPAPLTAPLRSAPPPKQESQSSWPAVVGIAIALFGYYAWSTRSTGSAPAEPLQQVEAPAPSAAEPQASTEPPSVNAPNNAAAPAAPPAVAAPPTLVSPPAEASSVRAPLSGIVQSLSASGWPILSGQEAPLYGVSEIGENAREKFGAWIKAHNGWLRCDPVGALLYRCLTAGNLDAAEALLLNGAVAVASDTSNEYRVLEAQARVAGRGIWKGTNETNN